MKKRKPFASVCLYLFVFIVCIVTLYPYFVTFITASKSTAEMYAADMTVFPKVWMWSNFIDIWSKAPVFRYLLNSILVAGGATLLAILCGVPAAYAMARMRFKGKSFFLGAVIMSQMFAPVVLLVGIYKLMVNLSLTNSILGLILLDAAFNQAFAIWLLRGTFLSISPEMEQAAKIDGCGTVRSLTRVLLPMAAPGIVTTLIFVFINAWNEYTIALTLISKDALKPITVGINVFYGYNMIQWQYLFATSLFATIPVIVLFLLIEKHLVAGLTSGGVKG
jgi:multiple sugar transport system permease protein